MKLEKYLVLSSALGIVWLSAVCRPPVCGNWLYANSFIHLGNADRIPSVCKPLSVMLLLSSTRTDVGTEASNKLSNLTINLWMAVDI